MIYFDNAATTYPKPQCVYDAIIEGTKKYMFNAGRGSYIQAEDTFKMIDSTREKVASFVNATKNEVIFTSSATEALNVLINGIQIKQGDYVYVSPFEHNAVIRPLVAIGANIVVIPFDKKTWALKEDELRDLMLLKRPKCAIISHISNVTGYELPYSSIFAISSVFGAINILDSAQGFGIYDINSKNIDYIVFAGHKSLYGVFGVAGFLKLSNFDLKPLIYGGTGSDSLNPSMPLNAPFKYEAGSPNSLAIYSIYNSIDYIKNARFDCIKDELANYFINSIKDLTNIEIYMPKNVVAHGIVSFNVRGFLSSDVGTILSNDYDICVRTGFHCCPLIHDFLDTKKYSGTVRVSFSGFNTKEEVDSLVFALKEL